jgi:hypothetical protein
MNKNMFFKVGTWMTKGVKIADNEGRNGWRILQQNKVRRRQKWKRPQQQERLPDHFQDVTQKSGKGPVNACRESVHRFDFDVRVFRKFTFKARASVAEKRD